MVPHCLQDQGQAPWGILGDISLFSSSQCSFFSITSPGFHTLDIQNHFRSNECSQNYPCICTFSSPVLIMNFLGPRAWQTGTNPLRPGSRAAPSGTYGRLSTFSQKPHPMFFPCKTDSLLGGGPAITQLGPHQPHAPCLPHIGSEHIRDNSWSFRVRTITPAKRTHQ